MPSASAARVVEPPPSHEYGRGRPHLPPPDPDRFEPRFRVVQKAPSTRRQRRAPMPVPRMLLLAAFPALCLLFYVAFGTMALRGAYYRDQLQSKIELLRVERAELEAEKRRLQAPGTILRRASLELGMKPASKPEVIEAPAPQQVAHAVR